MALKAKTTRRKSDSKEQAMTEVGKEETIRFNALVPVSLHRQVKVKATQEGKSMTEVVIVLLEKYLDD